MYALMALGVGLVFGVLRLVNFAYGQLVMAGAYVLAFGSQPTHHLWSQPLATWQAVVLCVAVVLLLSVAWSWRSSGRCAARLPAVMLVTTFAVAFMLQAVALLVDLKDDSFIGEPAIAVASLNQVVSVGGVDIRKVTILAVVLAAAGAGLLALFLARTRLGLQMRAASADFQTARLLGVRANRVIARGDRPERRDRRGRRRAARASRTRSSRRSSRSRTRSSCWSASSSEASTGCGRRRSAASRSASPPASIGGALPTEQVRLPAVRRLRARDRRPAAPAGGLFAWGGRTAVERV